jgi:hypothetical protein
LTDKENEIIKLLGEILKWTKFAGVKGAKDALNSVLETEQKKIVYQLSDGTKGMVEIGKAAGVSSTATISRYWDSWSKQGLGDFISVKGGDRFKRTFNLEDVGLEVPQIKVSTKTDKPPTVPETQAKTINIVQAKEDSHA